MTTARHRFRHPSFKNREGNAMPDTGGWQGRHLLALRSAKQFQRVPMNPHETSIVGMIEAWMLYAEAHEKKYASKILADGVLGPAWQAIGEGLLTLLNGDIGRLDAGTLDGVIRDVLGPVG